jgi:hypothetical protein
MKKHIITICALSLLYFFIFEIEIKTVPIGTVAQSYNEDPLHITSAYFDTRENNLIILTSSRWTQINISEIQKMNIPLNGDQTSRVEENILHWENLKRGKPDMDVSDLKPVAICFKEYASFGYMGDGMLWRKYGERATPPAGFEYAIFRGHLSYLLSIPFRGPDGRYGVQFFYDPGFRKKISFFPAFSKYGSFKPAFVLLCVSVFVVVVNATVRNAMLVFILSLLAHSVVSFGFLFAAGWNAGWSGDRSGYGFVSIYFILGILVLSIPVLIQACRSYNKQY